MWPTLILSVAHAGDPASPYPTVVRAVGAGAVDWTTATLVVTSKSARQTGAWKDRRMQEQDALDRLPPLVAEASQGVCLAPGVTGDDLVDGDGGARLREALGAWQVAETRYLGKGAVEMDAELDLVAWLRPALPTVPARRNAEPAGPGLLVDARGLDLELCLVPKITGPADLVVLDLATVSRAVGDDNAPVLFVTNPADPRVGSRLGRDPFRVRAGDADGAELLLDTAPPAEVIAAAAAGRVAIVVDP
jgi:hypothetical protein